MNNFPTVEQLEAMPSSRLRQIDIETQEQEGIIQRILNSRIATEPLSQPLNIRVPDITNGEQEAHWQAILDAEKARVKAQLHVDDLPLGLVEHDVPKEFIVPDDSSVPGVEELPKEQTPAIETEIKASVAPFCTSCDSKGGRHKKDCPTLTP